MSATCRIPESTSSDTSGPTASRTAAIVSAGGTARSSWRPPWLDSCSPSAPAATARRASWAPSGPLPLALAPTGYTRMVHPAGEIAAARAAQRHGLPYTLSTTATTTIP